MKIYTGSQRALYIAALGLPIAFAISSEAVDARMYQWSNNDTGTVQLSGTAPGWYRQVDVGPRVLVFDNGELVDDTAIRVSEAQRRRLRAVAFGAAAPAEEIEATPSASSEDLKQALQSAARDGVDVTAVTEAFTVEQSTRKAEPGPVEQTVAELKSLLDAWDSRRLNEAKELLRNAVGGASAPLVEQIP